MSITTPTEPVGKVVEGSDGLLLEIDGKIVPNYDATLIDFNEGDVVTGKVVRIDNDEVLVDIGYKSEGVIPAAELSIRKSVDTHDEVSLGEEVDALVLTKEDQDGRLILSRKRARCMSPTLQMAAAVSACLSPYALRLMVSARMWNSMARVKSPLCLSTVAMLVTVMAVDRWSGPSISILMASERS